MRSNIYLEFKKTVRKFPEVTFVHQASGKDFHKTTYKEAFAEVRVIAAYLNSLKLSSKTPVAILSENRYEWWIAYLATVSLGMIALPLDPQLTPGDWKKILKHAGARVLFFSDSLEEKLQPFFRSKSALKASICFGAGRKTRYYQYFSSLISGSQWKDKKVPSHNIHPDDVATLVYTSGTFGNPKGVLLSHQNILTNGQAMTLGYGNPGEIIATILPLHHMYGFTVAVGTLIKSSSLILFPEVEQEILARCFEKLRPHYLIGVPVFFEKVARGIEGRILKEAPAGAGSWILGRVEEPWGQFPPITTFLKKTLFRKIHQRFGGRLKFMASGGAPLDPHWIKLYQFLGFKFFEGYGLTETSPLLTCNDDQNHRVGSVGKAISGMEVRIDKPDKKGVGEICAKGPCVMKGYFKDPKGTAQVFDDQGWFHTGDLGYLDHDGFLFISGRKREIIVTASGKNVFPKELENLYQKSPLIEEVCVFGISPSKDSKAETVHIQIVPNRTEAKKRKINNLKEYLKKEINRLSQELASYKHPQSIGFSREPFPRTTTLKIKKAQVRDNYLKERRKKTPTRTREPGDDSLKTPEGLQLKKILKTLSPQTKTLSENSMLQLDLGLDSLSLIELATALPKVFGVTISESKLLELQSVGQLVHFLQRQPHSTKRIQTKSKKGKKVLDLSWSGILTRSTPNGKGEGKNGLGFPQLPRRVLLQLLNAFFSTLWDLKAKGLENIPTKGPFILAPNHNSYLDYFFVTCLLPEKIEKQTVVIAETEFFEEKEILQWIVRFFGQALFMDPKAVSANVLQKGAEVLKEGNVLLVYPEGVRSPDGKLQPLKYGASILANHVHCPIIPVYIQGSHEFWPKGASLPRRTEKITVHFGKPLPPLKGSSSGGYPGRLEAERLTRNLKTRILKMSQAGAPC